MQRPFDVLEERRKATMCGREHPNQEEGRRRSVLERQARVRSVIPKEGDIALNNQFKLTQTFFLTSFCP